VKAIGRRGAGALAAGVLLASVPAQAADELRGSRPRYYDSEPGSAPNVAAMDRRFWAPGLNDGYVPQGISFADGKLLMSAYRSEDPKVGSGPTRVYAVHADTGAELGSFDLPAEFGHAGGLAWDRGAKRLYVSDTRRLLRVDLARALAGAGSTAFERSWELSGQLRGSFAAFHDGHVWLGTWHPEHSARIYAIPLAALEANGMLSEVHATRSVEIPERAQGASFHADGSLWTSHSSSRFGELLKLDARTGKVLARFDVPIGIEDLGFDREGRLWSVSEAGTKRWLYWQLFFPLLFRIDPGKLQ